jgi:hypothetical protein
MTYMPYKCPWCGAPRLSTVVPCTCLSGLTVQLMVGKRVVVYYAFMYHSGEVIEETEKLILLKLDKKYCGNKTFWFEKSKAEEVWG